MKNKNKQQISTLTIVIIVITAIIILAGFILIITLDSAQFVLLSLAILFVYFCWRFLFG